jgi:hypothetical protein
MDALLAAMAFDPADRPSADEFRDRLSALSLGKPTTNRKSNGHSPAVPGATEPGEASAPAVVEAAPATDRPVDVEAQSSPEAREQSAPPPAAGDGGKEPPEILVDGHQTDDRHRSRRRTGILAGAVAVILAIALTAAALANLLPGQEPGAPNAPVTSAPVTRDPVTPAASAESTRPRAPLRTPVRCRPAPRTVRRSGRTCTAC